MKPADIQGEKGKAESFNFLDELLSQQVFRLSFWKVAAEEINYRRFFCVNGLISLRVEDEPVLNHTHGLIFDLIERRIVTGLRIDHVDGLYDPASYLQKVREKAPASYIIVEKILNLQETCHLLGRSREPRAMILQIMSMSCFAKGKMSEHLAESMPA